MLGTRLMQPLRGVCSPPWRALPCDEHSNYPPAEEGRGSKGSSAISVPLNDCQATEKERGEAFRGGRWVPAHSAPLFLAVAPMCRTTLVHLSEVRSALQK